jgi:aspartyl protease family protein
MKDIPAWLKLTTVWLLLGVLVFLGVQAWQAQQKASRVVLSGGELELHRASDGHYHWPGRINGREVEFLVDTGATGTAIPASLARELGLPELGTMQSDTAGGVVQGRVVLADLELHGGLQAQRLRLTALPQLASPLLGMDVLSRLRWSQHRGVMKIELQAKP